MKNFFNKNKEKIILFDDKGEQIKIENLEKGTEKIRLKINGKNRTYLINKKTDNYIKIKNGLMGTTKYYLFNLKQTNPFPLTSYNEPLVNSEDLDSIIETKVLKDLNQPPNANDWFNNIKIEHVLIGIGIIVVGVYFLQGGSLT